MLDRAAIRGGGALGAVLLTLVLAPAASTAASDSSWHSPVSLPPVKTEKPKKPEPTKPPQLPKPPEPKKPEPPHTGGPPTRHHDPFPTTPEPVSNPTSSPPNPEPTTPTVPTKVEPTKPITIPVVTTKKKKPHGERHGWPSFPSHETPSGPAVQPVTTPTPTPTPTTPTKPTPVTTTPSPTTHTPAPTHGRHPTGSGSQPSSGIQGRHGGGVGSSVAGASTGRAGAARNGAVSTRGLGRAGLLSGGPSGGGQDQQRSGIGRDAPKLPSAHPRQQSATIAGLLPNIPLPVPDWSKPIILGLLLICLLLALRAWRNGLKAQRLASESEVLSADLESAQAALVPEIPATMSALAVSVAYRPAEGPAAGGDFYDVFELDGGQVGVILGDVSGHGRNALARAAHMRYSLRAYLETGLDPRGALRLAGRVLDTEGDDLFTTVAIAVYNPSDSTLTYASAGHPAPVVAGTAAHEPVAVCSSPAIGWGVPTGRRQTTIPFPAQERACFFSDGVTEARVDGDLLGRARLGSIVTEVGADEPATEVLERVREGADSIHDDMAACVIEATSGAAAAGSVVEEFEAESRHLTAGQGQRFLLACGVPASVLEPTLSEAHRIAAEQGSAVLRVERVGESVTAAALAPTALMEIKASGDPAGSGAGAGAVTASPSMAPGGQVIAVPAGG